MLESTRQAYLHAMGIDSWLPTRPLPGAASTPGWVWQTPVPPATAPARKPPPSAPREGVDQARRDARAALRTGLPPSPPPAAKTSPASTTPEEVAKAEPVVSGATTRSAPRATPRFALTALLFGDCLVLLELPQASQAGLGEQHRRLLAAILRSLGLGRDGVLREERFRWPLLESSFMDMGEDVARAALTDRVELLSRQAPVSLILLFADKVQQLVLDRSGEPETLRGKILEGPKGIRTLATLSLHQALALPETKAEIWRDLQPLRAL